MTKCKKKSCISIKNIFFAYLKLRDDSKIVDLVFLILTKKSQLRKPPKHLIRDKTMRNNSEKKQKKKRKSLKKQLLAYLKVWDHSKLVDLVFLILTKTSQLWKPHGHLTGDK